MFYTAQKRSNLSAKLLYAARRKSKTGTITDLVRGHAASNSAAWLY